MEVLEVEDKKISIRQPKYAGFRISKEDYLKLDSDIAFEYDFNDGILEPNFAMKQDEIFIIKNLQRRFFKTSVFESEGLLFEEVDCWVTDKQKRRPDISYYTNEQIKEMAFQQKVIPSFVVEIMSENDEFKVAEIKLREYFNAGVKVVWRVFPFFKTVYVFTSVKDVKICMDDDVVSANPVIEDLQLTANQLFTL